MINPYESTATAPRTERRPWTLVIALWAGMVGYGLPVVALVLLAWLTHGWSVALENLERVVRIQRDLSPNTVAVFVPNLTVALLAATATIKWGSSDNSHRRWWMLGWMTLIGYVVVVYSVGRWTLIPWTWPTVLSNTVRSALTLTFPLVAYVISECTKRRPQPPSS